MTYFKKQSSTDPRALALSIRSGMCPPMAQFFLRLEKHASGEQWPTDLNVECRFRRYLHFSLLKPQM